MRIEDVDWSGACAYLEVVPGMHKTAEALQLKPQYLPLVAPCVEVVESSWVEEWCNCRNKPGCLI